MALLGVYYIRVSGILQIYRRFELMVAYFKKKYGQYYIYTCIWIVDTRNGEFSA